MLPDLPISAPPGFDLFVGPPMPPGPTVADVLALLARVGEFVAALVPWFGS